MTPDQALDRAIRAADLTTAETRGLHNLLKAGLAKVRAIIASAPSTWDQVHFQAQAARIERAMADLAKQLGTAAEKIARSRWETGRALADAALSGHESEAAMARVRLDPKLLDGLVRLNVDQLVGVAEQAKAQISLTLQRAILAGQTPHDAMEAIGSKLVDRGGSPAPGIWGDLFTRAEMTVRTDVGRALAAAQQKRLEQWTDRDPGLLKTWKAAWDDRVRPSHRRASEMYAPGGDPGPIPVDQPFILTVEASDASRSLPAGDYPAMYPRDPSLPPGLAVACRCASGPYRQEWNA